MMVDEELRRKQIYSIWFNAWKYDQEDNLWSALLQKILDQTRISGGWYRRLSVKPIIWWDVVYLDAGLLELTRALLPLLVRAVVFFLCAGIFLGWPVGEIQAFMGRLAPLLSPRYQALFAVCVKALLAVVTIIAAKPETLLKLFDARLGIDFSKLSRQRTYRQHLAFLDDFSRE